MLVELILIIRIMGLTTDTELATLSIKIYELLHSKPQAWQKPEIHSFDEYRRG